MKFFSKQQKYVLLGFATSVALLFFVAYAAPVFADTFGLQAVDDNIPLGNQDIRVTIGKIIRAALGLLGVIALGIILYGGFVYMTSGGSEEKITKAKQIIINGVIGLAIILSAFSITQFVLSKLAEATGSGGGQDGGCVGTWEECHKNDKFGSCIDKYFVSKSITPSQDDTDMNNVVIRAVFSKTVATAAAEVLRIDRGDTNITDKFTFEFVPGTSKKVLEAMYSIDNNCADENKKDTQKCLEVDESKYKVTLRENVVSETGELVNDDVDCQGFEPVKQVDFKVGNKVNDIGAPTIGSITFITEDGETSQSGVKLFSGTTYPVKALITDDKGISYVRLRVEKEGGAILLNTYDGPTKGNSDKPYLFQQNIVIPANAQPLAKYKVTIHAFDIDHNVTQASTFFFVVPLHCDNEILDEDKGETSVDAGGSCGCAEGENCQCSADVPCAGGLACVNGSCITHPEIVEISPQDGSPGNWISVIGKGFGKEQGVVEFGKDTNNDGKYEDNDEWIQASVVQCNVVNSSWTNNYAVVEVPNEEQKVGTALSLDGLNASAFIEPSPLFSQNPAAIDSFSMSAWIKADTQTNLFGVIASGGLNQTSGWSVYVNNAAKIIAFELFDASVSKYRRVVAPFSFDVFHHVIASYDKGAGAISIYVDGKEAKSTVFSLGALSQPSSNQISIGKRPLFTPFYFKGKISHFAVYKTALTTVQSMDLYKAAPADYKTTVLSYSPTLYYVFSNPNPQNQATGANPGQYPVLPQGSPLFGQTGVYDTKTSGIGQFSSIRIRRAADGMADASTDDYGVRPLPKDAKLLKEFKDNNYTAGVFVKKDNLKRPGLCAVVNSTNKPEGVPGIDVVADGKSFGKTQGGSLLSFGGLAASISQWADASIKASVPGNVNPGKIAVHAQVNNENSNKVLFTILGDDNDVVQPVVIEVSPTSTTKGSFVTIIGKNFGELTGFVHLAPSKKAKCPEDAGCKLLSFDLPAICGDTWSNTQIIGKIPTDINLATYHIIVERAAGLKSKPTHNVTINDGATLPGICKLTPKSGPAPLPPENTTGLELIGSDFSNDPTIYFWKNGAQSENLFSWLSSKTDDFLPGQGVKKAQDQIIQTFIPINKGDGQSMQSGLIKVKAASGAISNGVKYEVNDCREAKTPFAGYRCCSEGAGAGQWVKDSYTCPGEKVTSGYVWRFASGLIPNLPRVIEQCDAANWDNSGSSMPSPVPSILWPSGDAACVNANIEVALTVGLSKTSILGPDNNANTADDRIKVYSCGQGAKPVCDYKNAQSSLGPLDIESYDESEVLTIWNAKQKELLPNTWYRTVLSKDINSVPLDTGAGATEVKPLQATKTLSDLPEAAYYFDFKTGTSICILQKAFIVPPDKTTHILGLLKNPWDQTKEFYYHLKGKANQVCILVPVDGKGWVWSTDEVTKAKATVAPLKDQTGADVYKDSRATAEALADAPEGVAIQAKIPNAGNEFKASLTQLFSADEIANGISISAVFQIKKVAADQVGVFDFSKPFTLEYKAKINDDLFPNNRALAYRDKQFAVEMKADKSLCFTVPPKTEALDGPTQVSLCNDPAKEPFVIGKTYHYIWTWDGAELKMYDKNGIVSSAKLASIPAGEGMLYVGGEPGFFPVEHILYSFGILPNQPLKEAHVISHLNGGKNIDFFADDSMLYIDLFDPEVIYFEPNCSESCINADIRVDFNRQMGKETYADGFRVFKCVDGPNCKTLSAVNIYSIDENISTDISLRATISGPTKLLPNTWYKVSLNGNNLGEDLTGAIKSLGQLDPPKYGKVLPKTEWVFRTKNDATPCAVNRLEITPNPFTLYYVGHKAVYSVSPFSTPNACSKNGQALNKWDYGYKWSTADTNVATVSNFNSSFGWQPYCSAQCLRSGSDIPRDKQDKALTPALCGNEKIDAGEDCEITDTVDGAENANKNVCTLDCLYTKDKATALGLVDGSDPLPKGNLGEVDGGGKSYCGDGLITDGESCDTAISAVGCSSSCLHTGTGLVSNWCTNFATADQKNSSQCAQAVSVCGNGKIETNEECEVGATVDGVLVTAEICDNQCLFKDICDHNELALWCDKTSESCNDDCTLAGSSVLYKTPTLCGNGALESGEDAMCEITDVGAKKYEGQSGVQIATAIGKAQTDAEGKQETEVKSELFTNAAINGSADLTLQCGFVEFKDATLGPDGAPAEDKKIISNNCVDNPDNELGVGINSCCMPRPRRVSEYPASGTGLTPDTEPVCRNSYIEAKFDKEMLLNSISVDTPTILPFTDYFPYQIPASAIVDKFLLMSAGDQQFEIETIVTGAPITQKVFAVAVDSKAYSLPDYSQNISGIYSEVATLADASTTSIAYYVVDEENRQIVNQDISSYKVVALSEPGDVGNIPIKKLSDDNTYVSAMSVGGKLLFANPAPIIKKQIEVEKLTKIQELLQANLLVAVGYKDVGYICEKNSGVNVTADIQELLDTSNAVGQAPGFWDSLWLKVKSFFAWLVDVVFAGDGPEAETMAEAKVWCAAQIPIDAKISYDEGPADPAGTTSGLSIIIEKLLKPNAVHVVFMRGGLGGLRDVSGVGIKSPEYQSRNDAWFFKTGNKVCKIDSISASPAGHLFTSPNTQKDFQALAHTASGQSITSISGVYAWNWGWKPENQVFGILDVDSQFSHVSSTNVEGHVNGVVQATIIADLELENNQLGKKFTSTIDLTASFCENPWPAFNGSSWTPWKSDVYNFTFSYCADAGSAGNTADDLPYLKNPINLDVDEKNGQCQETGNACGSTSQCPIKYVFSKAGGEDLSYVYDYKKEKDGFCAIETADNTFVVHGQLNDDNLDPVLCSGVTDCVNGTAAQFVIQDANANGKTKTVNDISCKKNLGFPAKQMECQTGVLQKQLFLNDKNKDGLGFQIFKNEAGLSIEEWYKEQFENLGVMKKTTIADNEALTDGVNYYVSALNFVPATGKIHHNVYLFGVNPDASATTKDVLQKILNTLAFNTNMSDHGLCLEEDVVTGPDGIRVTPDLISDISCASDFDCRDAEGEPKTGTNGTCSNAKTKFFRDWRRLHDIEAVQNKLDAYFENTKGLPSFKADFKAGTFVPGYTNSRWSVSWGELSGFVDGAPLDPINNWTKCGLTDATDQQTCWNAADTVYHCPNFSQLYEYEYTKDNESYIFHAPLEFFKNSDDLADKFIDFSTYSAEPWCTGKGLGFSPSDEQCGNGIVGPNETCDPAGKVLLSKQGLISKEKPGKCSSPAQTSKSCLASADCPYLVLFDLSKSKKMDVTNVFNAEERVCMVTEQGKPYPVFSKSGASSNISLFICDSHSQCQNAKTYGKPGDKIISMSDLGKFIPISETQDNFRYGCNKLEVYKNYQTETAQCQGVKAAGTLGQCAANEIASNLCNATCNGIDYASCKPLTQCNNGIVETGEYCDDGALNGTYGHCAANCKALSASYCGDAKFDPANEACDWSHPDWDHGAVYVGQSKYYNFDKEKSCAWDCQAVGTYCGDGVTQSAEGEACDDGNTNETDVCNNQCQHTVEWCKQAVLGVTINENYSDDLKYATSTEIILGYNNEVVEECKNFSQKQICSAFKLPCLELTTHIEGNVYSNAACSGFGDVAIGEYTADTFEQVTLACPGVAPEAVVEKSMNPLTKDQCGNNVVESYKDKDGNEVIEVCDKGDKNGQQCDPSYGQSCTFCSEDCKTILTKDAVAFCGNGKIDVKSFDANGVAQYEACDVGTIPGADITLNVGDGVEGSLACTSLDAGAKGHIQCLDNCTKPDASQCVSCNIGKDKPIPKIALLNPIVANGSPWPEPKQPGNYMALYRMDLAKPFLGFTGLNYENNAPKDPQKFNYLFVDGNKYTPLTDIGLDTDLICKDDYKLHFNYRHIITNKALELGHNWLGDDYIKTDIDKKNLLKYGDLFPYTVAGESKEIKNEYIMSPAVPPNHFRVVVTWTKEEADKGHLFGGTVYNPAVFNPTEGSELTYTKALLTAQICANMKSIFGWTADTIGDYYWYPASGSLKKYEELGVKDQNANCAKYWGNVYAHAVASTSNTYAQAFTIDTDEYECEVVNNFTTCTWDGVVQDQGTFAFMVQSLNGSPIAQLTNSNVKVEIYTYHEGQVGAYSVYQPTKTFYIKDSAGTSTNEFASYWHVFNLEYKNGKYDVVPVESLETNFCQVKQNVPGAPQCSS